MRYEIAKNLNRNSLLDAFFGRNFFNDEMYSWTPAVDIVEKEGKYVLKADLPGVEEKDISVELQDNLLTIKGERKSEVDEEKDDVKRCERTYGSFVRTFTVYDVVEDKIEASYKNGILTLELPKKEETKPRKIEVRTH